ncbi:MAG: glycosyltransferase [Lysobacterales bacterium]
MRILLTADPFLPVPPILYGGIERVIALLVEQYLKGEHEVALLAHPDSTAQATAVYHWPSDSPSGLISHARNGRCFSRAIADFDPDVIHSFSRLVYLLQTAHRAKPSLMCYQREPTPRTVAAACRLLGKRLEYSGCSQYIADQGSPAGGLWHAVHNCVDCSQFPWVEHVENDAPLVFLSRVESIKGAHLAIEMARQTNKPLVIAGNHAESGAERDYFDAEITPQLDDQIRYVGPVNDQQKQQLLTSASAMVVPIQWNEPFGIVFAEALACGTPVITCPRGAAPEIVEAGEHGFLINSVEEGVAAIHQLADVSRAACRARAEQMFDVSVIAAQYLAILQQLRSKGH